MITLEVYSSLLKQENIPNPAGYIWKIAMNVRARFTDEMARAPFVLSDNEPEADDFTEKLLDAETKSKLRLEIAYLSRLRRKILILHYYRNMKLADIAKGRNGKVASLGGAGRASGRNDENAKHR